MNNKYAKYSLLVAATGVWIAVILRVVRGLRGGSSPNTTISSPVILTPIRSSADSFSLYADYPDPFLPESDTTEAMFPAKGANVAPPAPLNPNPAPVQEKVTDFVRLHGIISNPQKRSKVAILAIHGTEYLVKEGTREGNIRVIKIGKDQVLIHYKGEAFLIGSSAPN